MECTPGQNVSAKLKVQHPPWAFNIFVIPGTRVHSAYTPCQGYANPVLFLQFFPLSLPSECQHLVDCALVHRKIIKLTPKIFDLRCKPYKMQPGPGGGEFNPHTNGVGNFNSNLDFVLHMPEANVRSQMASLKYFKRKD